MKSIVFGYVGAIGAFICTLVGGITVSMKILIIFMVLDYITGVITAGVFKKSSKTESGTLSSKAGFKGIAKKCMMLFLVIIAAQLDILLNVDYCRNMVIISLILNELISITENIGAAGVPIPPVIRKMIEVLNEKEEHEDGNEREDN